MSELPKERIAKVIARSGFCSRRDAEKIILEGRVEVNGGKLDTPAHVVDANDIITIDGNAITSTQPDIKLWLFHKPKEVITSHSDPEGRTTLFSLIPARLGRVISVGRLDYHTEGLILLTNSGALSRYLESPQTGWVRRYRARAFGHVTPAQLAALKKGVTITDPKTNKPVRYGSIEATLTGEKQGKNNWIEFAITEGKNREVRNICEHLGLKVNRLIRTSYGPFQLGSLEPRTYKEVTKKALKEQLGAFYKTLEKDA